MAQTSEQVVKDLRESMVPIGTVGVEVLVVATPSARIQKLTKEAAELLPSLLALDEDARRELVKPLGNLDALVHLAARYASEGVIEVAG